jgi:histone deacetylase complex regulatory component SIN3
MAGAEETVYEITTKAAQGEVLIRLLRRSDATPGTSEERMYVESYVLDHPTQGLSQTPKVPYLRRCR